MSQPGYHPTCVLFQGNDCAFDGTYRLVCRHQIRPKDFQPGDNVEVDMGYDDDDHDAEEQDDNSTNGDGARWRDAIALGDKMVMSLLRNMCKNQPAGKTPWGSTNKQGKRKEDRDETDEVRTKRIKTEECTTSQETVDRVEGRSSRSDHLMQSILSAIHFVQAAQDLVTSELCSIRQGQQLLSDQVTAMQKTLNRLEDTVKLSDTASQDSESEQAQRLCRCFSPHPRPRKLLGPT
ncbi:uncharacterized protein LOC119719153 isoform X2 [Patiria miniata]|nr:uncharacterized protein LOC119719153 isoform X2 [Patiria miniata]